MILLDAGPQPQPPPLFAHQVTGARELVKLTDPAAGRVRPGCFFLGDEMRLGKSRCVVEAAQTLYRAGDIDHVLVIAPAPARSVWFHPLWGQIAQFCVEPVVVREYRDRERAWERQPQPGTPSLYWTVSNYEFVRRPERLAALLRRIGPRTVLVLDEAMAIKSPVAEQTRAIFKLRQRCGRVWPLDGTPEGDTPGDQFAPFKVMDPEIIGCQNWYQFRARYCNTPDAPIWMADQSFKALRDVRVGDEVMGWSQELREEGKCALSRRLSTARVLGVSRRTANNVVRVKFASGRVLDCTADHLWLSHAHALGKDIFVPVAHSRQRGGPTLCHVVEKPRELNAEERETAAWLAGVYDGEGSGNYIAQSATHNPEVCARIAESLDSLGIPWRRDKMGFTLKGGLQTYVNVLNWLPITRRASLERLILKSTYSRFARKADRAAQMKREADRVVSVAPLPAQEVVALQTTTGNYFPWGYASKNCVMGGHRVLQRVFNEQGRPIFDALGRPLKRMEPVQIIRWVNLDDLSRRTAPYILRRTMDQVFDLPPRLDPVVLTATLKPETWRLYKEMKDDCVAWLTDNLAAPAALAATRVMRLAQITSGFIGGVETAAGDPVGLREIGDEKRRVVLDWLAERLRQDPQFKTILWCRFRAEVEALARGIQAAQPAVEVRLLYGGMTDTSRDETKALLYPATAPARPIVVVGTARTGGFALNLAAASTELYVSNDWSRLVREQSEARILGPDQKRPAAYFDVMAEGPAGQRTVDHTVIKTLREKKNVASLTAAEWRATLEPLEDQ